jgi:hypothetical protein
VYQLLDLLDRSATGEPMAVADWDFAVAMATRRLVKKYGLDWDRRRVINDDPARASAIFDAAFDLAVELGVYNYSTGRVVRFTPDELLMGLRRSPRSLILGDLAVAHHPGRSCACAPRRFPASGAGHRRPDPLPDFAGCALRVRHRRHDDQPRPFGSAQRFGHPLPARIAAGD